MMRRPPTSVLRVLVPWALALVVAQLKPRTWSSTTAPAASANVEGVGVRTAQRRIGTDSGEEVVGLDELEQSLRIILTTPEGSVPGRPTFGSRLTEIIDRPAPELPPLVASEVPRAVRVSDPRIMVQAARVASYGADGGVVLQVVWSPASSVDTRTTEVGVSR